MLRVGLTGGIGAGKSTVAARLAELGALVLDADRLAREVVEPGTEGLSAVVAAFGSDILGPDGGLDRPALGRIVFGDERARLRLNGILHPLIAARTAAWMAAAPADSVIVHDVPLLVENRMAARYHLVIIVHADASERVARLVRDRGMTATDARARIEAQARDEQRRAVADAWLDNSGPADEVLAVLDRLWAERIEPYARNLRTGTPVPEPEAGPLQLTDPEWSARAERVAARIRMAAGSEDVRVEHVGSTAVSGLPARPVVDLGVALPGREADLSWASDAGLVLIDPPPGAEVAGDGAPDGARALLRGCDPGCPVTVRVFPAPPGADRGHGDAPASDGDGLVRALGLRDRLRADARERAEFAAVKQAAAESGPAAYREAKRRWWAAALQRAGQNGAGQNG